MNRRDVITLLGGAAAAWPLAAARADNFNGREVLAARAKVFEWPAVVELPVQEADTAVP